MIHLRTRGAAIALLIGLNTFWLAGCAVIDDGGYGYNTDVRVGMDYYDPWLGGYDDWGPGYRVAPPRQTVPRPDFGRDRPSHQGGYRPAPGSHAVPTIPSRPHSRDGRPRR